MPLTIQYCSDLHLEFSLNERFIKKYPLEVKGDILLLAGGIVPFAAMDKHQYFFDFAADHFEHTYWVPGNHEYYGADITERSGTVNEKIRSNVSLVNNVVVERAGVQFICSTLWSKINPVHEWDIERAMSDFHVIRNNGNRFSIRAFNELHQSCMSFLRQELANGHTGKKVAITHHVPTLMNYPPKYKESILNEAFAVELFDLIGQSRASDWIYGHHHSNTPDFKIGETTLHTNQLGYVKHGEHSQFRNDKVFIIE